jgi:hypothetical protein
MPEIYSCAKLQLELHIAAAVTSENRTSVLIILGSLIGSWIRKNPAL